MDSHPDSRLKTLVNTNTLCMGERKEDRKRGGGRERRGRMERRREREMFWRQNCFNIKKKQGVSVEVS